MKYFDFSFAGGFPLDQDALDWMQQGYLAALKSPYGDLPNPGKYIVSGCVDDGGDNWSAGWVYVDGELLPFIGSFVGDGIKVKTTSTAFYFYDGSSNVVKFYKYVEGDATGPLDQGDFSLWHTVFINRFKSLGRPNGTLNAINLPCNGATANGSVKYYKSQFDDSMVEMQGSITLTNAQSIFAGPPIYVVLFTIPGEFRPLVPVPLQGLVRYHAGSYILDATNTWPIIQINGEIGTDGTVAFGFIKPQAAIATYQIRWHLVYSLMG